MVIFSIPALALLFLQNQQVQTKLSQYVARTISENTDISVQLSSVNFAFIKRLQVRDLYIEDSHGDTLLFSELTKIRIRHFKPERRYVHIRSITLDNAYVNFVIDSSNVLNLKIITDPLRNPHLPPEKKLKLLISNISLNNSHFGLSRMMKKNKDHGVNFTDLDMDINHVHVSDLSFLLDTVNMDIRKLDGQEKSGFKIDALTSHLQIGKQHMSFTDTKIETPGSNGILPLIGFRFEDYTMFKTFAKSVFLNIASENSKIAGSDLAYFVSALRNYTEMMEITGEISGKVDDLKGENLTLNYNDRNRLNFDFMMIGLPDFKSTFLDLNFKSFSSNYEDLSMILSSANITALNDTSIWQKFGNLAYKGRFTGYPDNFVTSGLLGTDIGEMLLDLSFKPDTLKNLQFIGHLTCDDLQLGKLINQETFVGDIDMSIFADGVLKQNDLEATLDGVIDSLQFYNYDYSNIIVDGDYIHKTFDGRFSISDPNIKMDFEGLMDFSSDIPSYNFVADVARARPYYLKLRDDDPGYFASFLLETNLTGKTIDQLNGDVTLVNSLFERTGALIQMYNLSLTAHNSPDTSYIRLNSDFMDAEIAGRFKMSELPGSFITLMDDYLDVDPETRDESDSLNHLSYALNFKRMDPVLDFFLPDIQIGDNSTLSGTFYPSLKKFTGTGMFPTFEVAENQWNNLNLVIKITPNLLNAETYSDSLNLNNFTLKDQKLSVKARQDTAHIHLTWQNNTLPAYSGDINLETFFTYKEDGTRNMHVHNKLSEYVFNNETWQIFPSQLTFSHSEYTFDSLVIKSENKFILADGTYSMNESDKLTLSMKDLNLKSITEFVRLPAEPEGLIEGNIILRKENNNPYILSDLEIDTLKVNDVLLGSTTILARWEDETNSIQLDARSKIDQFELLNVSGDYQPGEGLLNFNIRLNNLELSTFERYTSRIATGLQGLCTAQITLDGSVNKPELNGTILFHNGSAVLNYLNTRYHFSDDVRIYRNNFFFI